jgi:hypothetical protein
MSDSEINSALAPSFEQLELAPYQFGSVPPHLQLPQELLHQVNEYVIGGRPGKPDFSGRVGLELCLVNKLWNWIFTILLYTQYRYHGSINKFWSLWAFLRTLVQRPGLGAYVQDLTLTTNEIYEPFKPVNQQEASEFINTYCDFPNFMRVLMPEYPQADSRDVLLGRPSEAYANALYMYNKHWISEALRRAMPDLPRPSGPPFTCATPEPYQLLYNGELKWGYQDPLTALVIAHLPQRGPCELSYPAR